jgi:hypothetical protein
MTRILPPADLRLLTIVIPHPPVPEVFRREQVCGRPLL